MPALQIRDLPDALYEGLKARAKAEHRSLAQEATVAIERHLTVIDGGRPMDIQPQPRSIYNLSDDEGREERIAKRKTLFAKINSEPKVEIPDDFPSPEEIIRELRDSR